MNKLKEDRLEKEDKLLEDPAKVPISIDILKFNQALFDATNRQHQQSQVSPEDGKEPKGFTVVYEYKDTHQQRHLDTTEKSRFNINIWSSPSGNSTNWSASETVS